MAEIVLSTFLSVAIDKLASAALEKLARSKQIHSDLKEWKTSLPQIQALLNDASMKEITDESVEKWLNRLKHLAYDIEDMLDDLETEDALHELTNESQTMITSKVRKLIPTCCTGFPLTTEMHRKVDDITRRLQRLEKETDTFGLIEKHGKPLTVKRMYETSLPDASHNIVGREDDKKKLVDKLLGDEASDGNFSIVPIVGMGGVGKTTLARLLYNEQEVNDHFELKAWVCVSDEFHIFNISQVIFQSMTNENKEFKDLNQLQEALGKQVMGKRFLLVLDDVWCECRDDWDNLVKPFHKGARGSKIIITTRKEQLLNELRQNHRNHLGSLSSDDALSLFALHAFGVDNFDSHKTLQPYGELVVNKCKCLPLALKALGRLLGTKADEEEWKEVLNSEIWRVGKGDEILPALRLSYHDLSACLKRLFAYCSLFPKDYLFDRKELVLLWMAEGFLHQSTSNKSMERWGNECFQELLSRSFFQHAPNDESLYVMHDLMNDLATSVAGDFFSRLDIGMKTQLMKDTLKRCRHMSLVCEEYITYEKFKAFVGAKCLRTFLALPSDGKDSWRRFYTSNTILADLLPGLPSLRVLSLSHLSISEVPECIGSLKQLRYLNLSHTYITHLPENVCSLCNLQTLMVCSCSYLNELPNNFLKLKNLRHFDIRNTHLLNKMPKEIGELESLRILVSEINIGIDNLYAVPGLQKLIALEGEISIKGQEEVQKPVHASDGSGMEWVEKEVRSVMKGQIDGLKRLKTMDYGGIEFPKWVGDPSFLRLVDVDLNGCKKCTSLPPLGQLPSLERLTIQRMDEVKAVGLELLGTTGRAFPSLKRLGFYAMKGWEIWSTNTDDGVVDAMFPCLEELIIDECPKLVEISVEALSSLRVLEVIGCGDGVLRSLVHVASSSLAKLKIRSISGLTNEAWGGVIEHLGEVEEVSIDSCNEIRFLWESEAEANKVLMNLRELFIQCCSNLVRLGEKEEEDNSVSVGGSILLTSLMIWNCKNMERCRCPHSIERLDIRDCDSMTSVSFPTGGGGGQKLKFLWIDNCDKLVLENDELAGGGENKATLLVQHTSMPLLETVIIGSMKNLESIVELRSFIHLTWLTITECPNIKSFPDLQNLSVLKDLLISYCPQMDASSVSHGLWPPNLDTLSIGGLKKSITEWGSRKFPTSLVKLILLGGYSVEEGVSSWSEFSHFLPPSLTTLEIREFKNLESVSKGLQRLTSLKHLEIIRCPMMKCLPETKSFLPSLLSLIIIDCPKLKKRYIRRSSKYWPLISYIPCIEE